MQVRLLLLSGASLMWLPHAAAAQGQTLTLEEAFVRARAQAPRVLAAKARIAEARARLVGASLRLRENPLVEGSAGPRATESGNAADFELGISQAFELGDRRGARIAGAEAAISREIAASEEAMRRVLREVGIAFSRVLHAEERVRLLAAAEQLASEILEIATRRFQAGDVAILDVNVARTARARARSEIAAADSDRLATLGELRVLLGMSAAEPVAVRGDLRARRRYELPELLAGATSRPELRALAADIREAEADVRLGRGSRRPDVGIGVRFEREEGDRVLLGGLTFTLPVFARGQELLAAGTARAARAELELDASRRAIETEVRTAFEAYARRLAAVEELEREALPGLDENDALARRSFEVGQLSLPELLLIRREILDVRLDYLDRLLEANVARIEQDASAGVLR